MKAQVGRAGGGDGLRVGVGAGRREFAGLGVSDVRLVAQKILEECPIVVDLVSEAQHAPEVRRHHIQLSLATPARRPSTFSQGGCAPHSSSSTRANTALEPLLPSSAAVRGLSAGIHQLMMMVVLHAALHRSALGSPRDNSATAGVDRENAPLLLEAPPLGPHGSAAHHCPLHSPLSHATLHWHHSMALKEHNRSRSPLVLHQRTIEIKIMNKVISFHYNLIMNTRITSTTRTICSVASGPTPSLDGSGEQKHALEYPASEPHTRVREALAQVRHRHTAVL